MNILKENLENEKTAYEFLLIMRLGLAGNLEGFIPLDDIVEAGVIPGVVKFLASPTAPEKMKCEAAWLLNIVTSSKDPTHVMAAVKADAVPAMISLLSSDDPLLLNLVHPHL